MLSYLLKPESGSWNLRGIIDARMIQSLMDDFQNYAHSMAIVNPEGRVLVGVDGLISA